MAITYPLSPPASPGFSSCEFAPRTVVGMHISPFTLAQQVYAWPGQGIGFNLGLPPMNATQAGEWSSFFLGLNGPQGTFLFRDPTRPAALGTVAGTWKVNTGATANATTLPLVAATGMDATENGAGLLVPGDWIQVGGINQLLRSNAFTATPWAHNQITVTAAAATNPISGASDVALLEPSGADAALGQIYTPLAAVMTFSVYLKTVTGTADLKVYATDTAGTIASADLAVTSSYKRFVFTFATALGEAINIQLGGGGFWGTGEDLHGFGAQMNPGSVPMPYTPTTTAAITGPLYLHRVTKVLTTSGVMSGVDVFPRLRSAYAAGSPIGHLHASGVFRLGEIPPQMTERDSIVHGMDFTALEAI